MATALAIFEKHTTEAKTAATAAAAAASVHGAFMVNTESVGGLKL